MTTVMMYTNYLNQEQQEALTTAFSQAGLDESPDGTFNLRNFVGKLGDAEVTTLKRAAETAKAKFSRNGPIIRVSGNASDPAPAT